MKEISGDYALLTEMLKAITDDRSGTKQAVNEEIMKHVVEHMGFRGAFQALADLCSMISENYEEANRATPFSVEENKDTIEHALTLCGIGDTMMDCITIMEPYDKLSEGEDWPYGYPEID